MSYVDDTQTTKVDLMASVLIHSCQTGFGIDGPNFHLLAMRRSFLFHSWAKNRKNVESGANVVKAPDE